MKPPLLLQERRANEAGAHPQQAGLTGTVGALEQNDLALGNVEVDASQDGKPPEEGDCRPEADGTGHGKRNHATGAWRPCSIQARLTVNGPGGTTLP